MRKNKKTKVNEMKLGRFRSDGFNVYGFALIEKNEIYIESRLNGKKYMDTLIHEKLHIMFPDWSETKVLNAARKLTVLLWDHSYRRTSE